MFDLFRSRAKAVRYMLGAILLMVALAMVITLVPGFVGASYDSGNPGVLAEIGDDVVTAREVQLLLNEQMRAGNIPREMASTYAPILVNQMISDRAVAYYAGQMGFQVSDAEVAFAVESMIPSVFQGGQFVGQDLYAQYLKQMGYTIPEFEEYVRKQLLQFKVENMALEATLVTDREIEAEYRRRHEQIRLEYVSISPALFQSGVNATEEEMREYYETNQRLYNVPEQRDVELVIIEPSAIGDSATVPEAQLRQAYQNQIDRFRFDDRVRVRHILLNTMEKTDEEKQETEQEAEEILQKLKDGADFAEMAREYSEDAGTAQNGGELGWITRGQTVANFEAAAFSLPVGQLSDVISTEYGYHIIEVEETEEARQQPFEEVRDRLEAEMSRQYLYDRIQEVADTVEQELTADPDAAEEIATEHGLQFRRIQRFTGGGSIPELSSSAEALSLIASMGAGEVTPVIQSSEDTLVVAAVTAVYPSRPSDFEDVKDRVRSAVVQEKATEQALQKAEELEKRLETAGEDLAGAARDVGLDVQTSDPFTLNGTAGELGSAYYFEQAFESPVGTVLGPINAASQGFYVKVIEKTEADMEGLDDERETISTELRQSKAAIRKQLLDDGILTRLIEEGKVKINQNAIDAFTNAYQTT